VKEVERGVYSSKTVEKNKAQESNSMGSTKVDLDRLINQNVQI